MEFKTIGIAAGAFVVGGALAFAFLGVNAPSDESEAASAAAGSAASAPASPAKTGDDPVVGRVDDSVVHVSDLEDAKALLPEQIQTMPLEAIYRPLLDRVIDGRLMVAAARAAKLGNDPELQQRIALASDQLLQDAYMTKVVADKVNDATLQERYDAYVADLLPEDEVRARHILLKTEDEAKAVVKELEGGADFAKLAEAKSTGPSKSKGGDLGYFGRGQMVKEFSDAAFELKKGNFSKPPIQTQFGWHVILVEDHRTKPAPGFDDMRETLERELQRTVLQDEIALLRGKAEIERFNMDGTPLKDPPAGEAAPAEGEAPAGEEAPASEAPAAAETPDAGAETEEKKE